MMYVLYIPYLQKMDVLLVGDSIVQGVRNVNHLKVISFRGDNIVSLKHRFLFSEVDTQGKEIIILHVGTNDLKKLTPETFLDEYKKLLLETRLECMNATIAISLMISRLQDYDKTIGKIKQINNMLSALKDEWNVEILPSYRCVLKGGVPGQQDVF